MFCSDIDDIYTTRNANGEWQTVLDIALRAETDVQRQLTVVLRKLVDFVKCQSKAKSGVTQWTGLLVLDVISGYTKATKHTHGNTEKRSGWKCNTISFAKFPVRLKKHNSIATKQEKLSEYVLRRKVT